MRVLVTGAAGFVGYAVAALLVEQGHEVAGLTRSGSSALPKGVQRLESDLREPETLPQIVARGRTRNALLVQHVRDSSITVPVDVLSEDPQHHLGRNRQYPQPEALGRLARVRIPKGASCRDQVAPRGAAGPSLAWLGDGPALVMDSAAATLC